MPRISEEMLARELVEALTDLGLDIYQEVAPWGREGARCDIVVKEGKRIHAIEVKTSLSLQVIAQAKDWMHCAHRVSIAVPKPARHMHADRSRGRQLGFQIAGTLGIGIYEGIKQYVKPKTRRVHSTYLMDALCDGQKSAAAAGSMKGYWTPFRQTCESLKDHLKAHPGSTMKAAVESIDHHYANNNSAKTSLATMIRQGVIDGIRVDESVRPFALYLEEKA